MSGEKINPGVNLAPEDMVLPVSATPPPKPETAPPPGNVVIYNGAAQAPKEKGILRRLLDTMALSWAIRIGTTTLWWGVPVWLPVVLTGILTFGFGREVKGPGSLTDWLDNRASRAERHIDELGKGIRKEREAATSGFRDGFRDVAKEFAGVVREGETKADALFYKARADFEALKAENEAKLLSLKQQYEVGKHEREIEKQVRDDEELERQRQHDEWLKKHGPNAQCPRCHAAFRFSKTLHENRRCGKCGAVFGSRAALALGPPAPPKQGWHLPFFK